MAITKKTEVILFVVGGVVLLVIGFAVGIAISAGDAGAIAGAGSGATGGLLAGLLLRGKGSKPGSVGGGAAVVHDKLQADLDKALAGRQESAARLQQLGTELDFIRSQLTNAKQQLAEADRRYGILELENGKLRDSIRASQQSGSDLDKLIGGQG